MRELSNATRSRAAVCYSLAVLATMLVACSASEPSASPGLVRSQSDGTTATQPAAQTGPLVGHTWRPESLKVEDCGRFGVYNDALGNPEGIVDATYTFDPSGYLYVNRVKSPPDANDTGSRPPGKFTSNGAAVSIRWPNDKLESFNVTPLPDGNVNATSTTLGDQCILSPADSSASAAAGTGSSSPTPGVSVVVKHTELRPVQSASPIPSGDDCPPSPAPRPTEDMVAMGRDEKTCYHLAPAILVLDGNATATPDVKRATGESVVRLSLDSESRATVAKYGAANLGKQIAIVKDQTVLTAPTIQAAIDGEITITGDFTPDSAAQLCTTLGG
jgi:hypothetical protein